VNEYRYALSFRALHPNMTANDIEQALSLKVRVSNTAGEKRMTPKGKPLDGTNKNSYCSFRLSEGPDTDLEAEINKWNKAFSSKRSFFTRFVETGGQFEYFIGLFLNGNSGFSLSVEAMRGMEELGIELALDIYP
jgi:hypothetical protein